MNILTAILFILAAASTGGAPAATSAIGTQGACPVEVADSRRVVARFLNHPAYASSRSAVGVSGAQASDIRLLTDTSDSAACVSLNAIYGTGGSTGEWHWSYFEVGGRYFVSIQHIDTPTATRVGFVPLFVYDSAFQRIGGFSM